MKYILITLLAGIVVTAVRVLSVEILSKIKQVIVIGTLYSGSYYRDRILSSQIVTRLSSKRIGVRYSL